MSNPIKRLHADLARLRRVREAEKSARKELGKDRRELARDRKELKQDRRAGDRHHKLLDGERKAFAAEFRTYEADKATLARHTRERDDKLAPLQAEQAQLEQQYEVNPDPQTAAKLEELKRRQAAIVAEHAPRLAADQQQLDQSKAKVLARRARLQRHRARILELRKEIKGDIKEIKGDKAEVKQDRRRVSDRHERAKRVRRTALEHLRPAEYKMGLKATNRARKQLGLRPVNHVIRPANLNTVQGCAQYLMRSKNVSFWTGLSTGSDRKNLALLARGQPARVPATGGRVYPKLSMMRALVDMAKHGKIMITALTGGTHSVGSNHYRGTAVDLSIYVGSSREIEQIANKYGGRRNFETDHIHLDF